MKIFIADDSALLCSQLIELLSELKEVEIVGQAQDALEAFERVCELKPDVVTLDIKMMGGSGIDVLKKIKREKHPPIVIMLTNFISFPYRKKCMEAGADFFLDKSTEFVKLKAIIQDLAGLLRSTAGVAQLDYFGE